MSGWRNRCPRNIRRMPQLSLEWLLVPALSPIPQRKPLHWQVTQTLARFHWCRLGLTKILLLVLCFLFAAFLGQCFICISLHVELECMHGSVSSLCLGFVIWLQCCFLPLPVMIFQFRTEDDSHLLHPVKSSSSLHNTNTFGNLTGTFAGLTSRDVLEIFLDS